MEWNGRTQCRCWQWGCRALPLAGAKSDSGQRPMVAALCLYPGSLQQNAEKLFLGMQADFWVIGSLEPVWQDHWQGFVSSWHPWDVPGLSQPRIPNPAACSSIQLVNRQSLRLRRKRQCVAWPLRKPAMGAVSSHSGKGAHPQDDVPCSSIPELGLLCPLDASLLILVVCALASSICVQ